MDPKEPKESKEQIETKEQKEPAARKEISFPRLVFEAVPEIWTFQILAAILLAIPAALLMHLINWIAGIGGDVVTSSTLKSFILSWRFPVILFLGIVLVLVYLVMELLAQIYQTGDILGGRRAGVRKCVAAGIRSLKRFMNPAGIGIIIFIVLAVPLCGVGFSLSLSRYVRIPNFIMDVIRRHPLLMAGYIVGMLALIRIAFRSVFALHAVLLDDMKPSEGKKYSVRLVKEHFWEFLKGLILTGLVIIAVIIGSQLLFSNIPGWILGGFGDDLPKGYRIDVFRIIKEGGDLSETEINIIVYRIASIFAVLIEKYLISVVALLGGSCFMLRLNRYYLEYSGRGRELWPERPKKARYIWKVILIIAVFVLFFLVSIAAGIFYNSVFTRKEPVKIISHRAGGILASENSIEGLKKSIEHGCYGCEIDIQRTKDGYYIVNHDNDFKRLTGVEKTPQDMTMEEIKELRIKDTTGNGQEHPVATLEEMLDVIKGKTKLFVELKGPTADTQMVDDVVRIIRDHDCVEDTALISLNYDIIKYAETTYPEFETGTLFFGSLGDVSKLTCDLLIMEEATATDENIDSIKDADKQAIVWTVNTRDSLYHFLSSDIDAVITDEIPLSEEVQAVLDDRTDLEVVEDRLSFLDEEI